MCLLTTSTINDLKSVFLNTSGLIADVYMSNSDGLGVMYSDGTKLHVRKVLPKSVAEARQFIESLPDSDQMIACHWRMKTHGLIDMENCHPYMVNADTYLAHNGILHTGNKADPEKSDTWHFIKDYLTNLPTDALHDAGFLEMVGEFIENNRFAIMSADGRLSVVNRKQGVEAEGIWFSNVYAWSPEMLIPSYRSKYTFVPMDKYSNGRSVYPMGKYDWLDDEDEVGGLAAEFDTYDEMAQDVDMALYDYDEDGLTTILGLEAATAVDYILANYRITRYMAKGATKAHELPKFEAAIVDAWLDGDDAFLVGRCRANASSVAQCLLYYCDVEAIHQPAEPDEDEPEDYVEGVQQTTAGLLN